MENFHSDTSFPTFSIMKIKKYNSNEKEKERKQRLNVVMDMVKKNVVMEKYIVLFLELLPRFSLFLILLYNFKFEGIHCTS